jgi:hypothetical protein
LDIAIGSSSRFFQSLSSEEKSAVVSEKGDYVRSIGGSPFAVSDDVAYAAIASCARDAHSASIDLSSTEVIKAAELWQTFADRFIARHSKTLPHLQKLRPKTPEQIINTALELFPAKNRKQIPRAKLEREVQSLKPGTYFLCRIAKRTKIAKRAAGLSAAFGIKRLRVGACRILDYERLSAIQHMITDEIVQVAPLEVPE